MMSDFRGLYIHVPFCVRKCPYCDFYSTAGRGDLLENYAAAVVRNLREYPEQFDTVYFGGGTPNLMAEYMPGILQAVSTIPGAEISAECNPASASPETLRIMRRAGVNRISVGVQSLQDNELKKLGRLHNAKQAEELIVQARQAGFDSISADVMLGVPGQTADSLTDTLERLAKLPIQHISAYMLTLEQLRRSENRRLRIWRTTIQWRTFTRCASGFAGSAASINTRYRISPGRASSADTI